MKKILMIFGVSAMMLTLSACGTQTDTENLNDNYTPKLNNTPTETSVTPFINEDINTDSVELATTTMVVNEDLTRVIPGQKDLFKDYSGAIIKTSEGDIKIKFYAEAPITSNNFMNLAQKGFYNGTKFHRVMKDFMIQGGDPLTKENDASAYGMGGPGYKFNNEDSNHKLIAGNIAMANSGLNTNGSQFFIVTAESTPFLDGGYTNFGEVVSGMAAVRKIENSEVVASSRGELSVPVDYITVKSVELIK